MYGDRKKTGVIEIERDLIGGSPIVADGIGTLELSVADFPELEGLNHETDTLSLWIDPETPVIAG